MSSHRQNVAPGLHFFSHPRDLPRPILCCALLALGSGACATGGEAAKSAAAPGHALLATAAGTSATRSQTAGGAGVFPGTPPGGRHASNTLPGGLTCLLRLRALGIPHRTDIRGLPGVETPIRLTGPVDGVVLRPTGRRPADCDCRLALALHRAAPLLRAMGVSVLHYSNTLRRGRLPSGRPSRHALGLAIDVHRLTVGDQQLSVEEDFRRGLADGCAPESPVLNRLACRLKAEGYFDRVLSPDTDRAHRNHFHLAILSLHRRRFVPKSTPPAPDTD